MYQSTNFGTSVRPRAPPKAEPFQTRPVTSWSGRVAISAPTAPELRNTCRRAGVQLGTIDALLAQLCVRHRLTSLTTDNGSRNAAAHCQLKVRKWPLRCLAGNRREWVQQKPAHKNTEKLL